MAGRRGGDTSTGEQRNPQNFAQCKSEKSRDIDSERVAIGRAIEQSLAWRKGTNQYTKEDVQNFAQADGKKTIEIAAQKAGFNNKETYRQAKSVVDNGVLDQSRLNDFETSSRTRGKESNGSVTA